jgi:hypothetical protein
MEYYNPKILEDRHKMGTGYVYYVPSEGPLETYINYIK